MIKSLYPLFYKWCENGSIYIISDTHFDDSDCKYMDPNWITPEEHINIIKKIVHKNDTLIHLGDVGNGSYMDELKCYKVLLSGNHDVLAKVGHYFNEIFTGPIYIADRILLSHEPIYGVEDFCINIHGHVHGATYEEYGHINLASDVTKFTLFNLGAEINRGLLSKTPNYHRITIDHATKHPIPKTDFKDEMAEALKLI